MSSDPLTASRRPVSRRLVMTLPLLATLGVGAGFYALLERMRSGRYDPHEVDNPLIGHPVPSFPPLPPQPPAREGFGGAEILALHRPLLVNFFASWCQPCRIEHPALMALAPTLPIWGVAYKDAPDAISALLAESGNPYQRIGRDAGGRAAIEWGVYGVPETFLIDANGIIRGHWAGPLGPDIIEGELKPLLRHAS